MAAMTAGNPLTQTKIAKIKPKQSEIKPKQVDWSRIDDLIATEVRIFHQRLADPKDSIDDIERSLTVMLCSVLAKEGLIEQPNIRKPRRRRETPIEDLTRTLKNTKNASRHLATTNNREFMALVRAHNKAHVLARKQNRSRDRCYNESKFRSNPFEFSKRICSQPASNVKPSFSSNQCLDFFRSEYSADNCHYQFLPNWVEKYFESHTTNTSQEFNMEVITPQLVKKVLRKCSSKSTPGANGLAYSHLKHLPSVHHVLATLYTKILLSNPVCPKSWCVGKIILIHKRGDCSNPRHFRPIAMTSVIGKLFHRILAERLEHFLLQNEIVNPEIQKGFVSGISGSFEHSFMLSGIIENAKASGNPLYISLLDLSNAFGSISHTLIKDIIQVVGLPSNLISYLVDAYSKLSGFVHTREWDTDFFPLKRGIFQGDPLSPRLFLLLFAPVIGLIEDRKDLGYQPKISIPDSEGLPLEGSHIYLLWDEDESDEPKGWYRCQVGPYSIEGQCHIQYPDGQSEIVNLKKHKWMLAARNGRIYRSCDDTPPALKLPKDREKMKEARRLDMAPQRSKAFADDLTVISKQRNEHQELLNSLSTKCREIDLVFNPSKCISYSFNGKSVTSDSTFQMDGLGTTQSLKSKPTKFLGKMIGFARRETQKASLSNIKSILLPALKRISDANVRGEYKVWVYQNYLMPSLNFHLTVSDISRSQILNLQKVLTKNIKAWLNLPRSLTPAVLFHSNGLALAHLPTMLTEAKARLLLTVQTSRDDSISSFMRSLNADAKAKLGIHLEAVSTLKEASAAHLDIHGKVTKSKVKAVKTSIKTVTAEERNKRLETHLETLVVQNAVTEVFPLEEETRRWKRLLTGLPAGQLSFVLKAATGTLPAPMTLRRMGFQVETKCPLCDSPCCTARHILNSCPDALNRYKWRHNQALQIIVQFLKNHCKSNCRIFADLDNWRATDNPPSTIPPSILATRSAPDIVIMDHSNPKKITAALIELTVPWNSEDAISNAHRRKATKENYCQLVANLHSLGIKADLLPIEIGSLGHYNRNAAQVIKKWSTASMKQINDMYDAASTKVISCSQTIFFARHSRLWQHAN